jgi:hypothetical protein
MACTHRLSASSLKLARYCLYSYRGDVAVPFRKPHPSAEKGVRVHGAIESFLRDGEIVCFDPGSGEEALFSAWLDWHDRSVSDEGREAEAAYRLDVMTGRAWRVDRDRSKRERPGPHELTVILDLVERRDGVTWITDWKTGKPADAVDQLATCALAVHLADGDDVFQARPVYISPLGVSPDPWVPFDALDLDAHLAWLRERMSRLPDAQPEAGEWCQRLWCELREKCHAHRAWLKETR